MHQRTIATLAELEAAAWFSKVGVKDTEAVIVLSSWPEAITHCDSVGWKNLCLEAVNQYRQRLLERSRERFIKWNDIVTDLRPTVEPFVHRKVQAVVQENLLPPIFEKMVRGDIFGVCLEAEYADVYPPGFYASHAYWYVKGHFPCGYEGLFPNGKLIVY